MKLSENGYVSPCSPWAQTKCIPFSTFSHERKDSSGIRSPKEWEREWKASKKGEHLRRIDTTLPSVHTRWMYGSLPRNRAYLLTQLRTGHSWLATHGKLHRFREDDKCVCGAKETVIHVLVDCPRLRELRQELQMKIGSAFNSVSCMLGGGIKKGKEGKVDNAPQDSSTIGAVLYFAKASQRFRSRAPRGPHNRTPGT